MKTEELSSRWQTRVCTCILVLGIVGKIAALIHGSGLLKQAHSFLPGTFGFYIWLGLFVELVTMLVLFFCGKRLFLVGCLGLGVLFVGYHALEVGLDIQSPCPCLGGLLGRWKRLAQLESTISFSMAALLVAASFLGLASKSRTHPPGILAQSAKVVIGCSVGLWCLCGVWVVWFWSGYVLGGDESMEAAKSLQYLHNPESVSSMWNDQPPLWSIVGAGFFSVFGPSLTVGRVAVVLMGVLLPVTWATYAARIGVKWASLMAIVFLWLATPARFASYMLEAPAYAVGISALVPLLLLKGRGALLASAAIGALALSLKLTAAFALLVPFVFILQSNQRHALMWGCSVVVLTILSSFVQPGWSWGTMGASHLGFAASEALQYHLNPATYVSNWLMCLLSAFAMANRYVNRQMNVILPWVAAAMITLLIHMFHHPFWDYYDVHLMSPIMILAGIGIVDLWQVLQKLPISFWTFRVVVTVSLLLCGLWAWQKVSGFIQSRAVATQYTVSPITVQLKPLAESGHSMFSMDPLWTFAAGQVQTPLELTIIPRKRVWAGQINDQMIVDMLASNKVNAIVVYQSALKKPAWTNLLATHYLPTARENQNILFVRRELNPKPIDLLDASETAIDLKQLGL